MPGKDDVYRWGFANHEIRRIALSLADAEAAAEYGLEVPRQFHPVATAEWVGLP